MERRSSGAPCCLSRAVYTPHLAGRMNLETSSGFARKVPLTCLVAAMPPDVRRGYASPFSSKFRMGFALGSGFAPTFYGPEAEPGA